MKFNTRYPQSLREAT